MTAVQVYVRLCRDAQVDAALEFVNALSVGAKDCLLSDRQAPLMEIDVCCVAEALRLPHTLRTLDLDGNRAGMRGTQALLAALLHNPSLRELRLGHNDLGDPSTVVVGSALASNGLGLRILDLSLNSIGKIGCLAICQALASKACELSELSLHGNVLDADCGIAIAQALKQSGKLKHLHLGFNALRDAGAVHIARALTSNRILCSLDLTGNGIGSQGGKEIAWALTSGSQLQRLCLRQNNFDDETFNLFAEVIRGKSFLTHLSLGQMHPSASVAENVFRALSSNRTIVSFEAMGWECELSSARADNCLRTIGAMNTALRAITSDVLIADPDTLDNMNRARSARGVAPLYVGADERKSHAAVSAEAPTPVVASVPVVHSIVTDAPREAPRTEIQARSKVISVLVGDDDELKTILRSLEDSHCECKGEVIALAQHYHLKIQTLRATFQQQVFDLSERVRQLESNASSASWKQGSAPRSHTTSDVPAATQSREATAEQAHSRHARAIAPSQSSQSTSPHEPAARTSQDARSQALAQPAAQPTSTQSAQPASAQTAQPTSTSAPPAAQPATAAQTAGQTTSAAQPSAQHTASSEPTTSGRAESSTPVPSEHPLEPNHNSTPAKPVHHRGIAEAEARSPSLQHSRGLTHEATPLGSSPPKQELPVRRGLRNQPSSHK